jgi:hypothetical protein
MATELDRQKGETVHFYPQVLPGSQAVLFTASTGSPVAGNRDNIDVLSFKTGERKTLVRGSRLGRYLPSGHLVYLHQNTLLAAAFDLGKLAVTGAPQAVLEDVSYTRRGRWFTSAGNADIWVQDIERDTAVRLTSLPGANGAPLWTPDGKYIVFLSANQPSAGIYRTRADGSGEPQRLAKRSRVRTPYFPHRFLQTGNGWLCPPQAAADLRQTSRQRPSRETPAIRGLESQSPSCTHQDLPVYLHLLYLNSRLMAAGWHSR